MIFKKVFILFPVILLLGLGVLFDWTNQPSAEPAVPADCMAGPHSGNIPSDQDWCPAENPHDVTISFNVYQGVTQTIQLYQQPWACRLSDRDSGGPGI
jgi:hypothetical protein